MSVLRRRMMMAPPRMGYVEGMAAHFDGIYNTPVGHGAVTEWTNLAGGAPLSVVGDAAWAGDGLDLSSNLNYPNFAGQAYVVEQEPSVVGDAYTIEVVVSWGEPRWTGVLLSALGVTNFYRYIVLSDDTHKIRIFGGSLLSTPILTDNMLLTFSVVFQPENNSKTYYANGIQAHQNNDEAAFTGTPIVIGGSQTPYANYPGDDPYYPAFPGIVHGLRIYNRVLSADEIAHNAQIDQGRFAP